MIDLIPIKVECYSGYKADEYPKRFLWNDKQVEIKDILDRWYQGNNDPEWPIGNYFKVISDDGTKYIIKRDLECGEWYLITQDENKTL